MVAFPLRPWLRERAAVLRCTYIACLVVLVFFKSDVNRAREPAVLRVHFMRAVCLEGRSLSQGECSLGSCSSATLLIWPESNYGEG